MKYMKIKPESIKIINPLVEVELEQVLFYKQLAAIANKKGYLLAEKFFIGESIEEATHFDKWQSYIVGRGNDFSVPKVSVGDIGSPKDLYELIESALQKEIEVSEMYSEAAMSIMGMDQLLYQEVIDFLKIQNEAIKAFTDYCGVLEDLDKAGQLVAEHSLFEEQ